MILSYAETKDGDKLIPHNIRLSRGAKYRFIPLFDGVELALTADKIQEYLHTNEPINITDRSLDSLDKAFKDNKCYGIFYLANNYDFYKLFSFIHSFLVSADIYNNNNYDKKCILFLSASSMDKVIVDEFYKLKRHAKYLSLDGLMTRCRQVLFMSDNTIKSNEEIIRKNIQFLDMYLLGQYVFSVRIYDPAHPETSENVRWCCD